jgi:hypothetical protein
MAKKKRCRMMETGGGKKMDHRREWNEDIGR